MELTVRLEAVGAPDPAARRPGRRRQIRWESGGGQRASSGGHPRPLIVAMSENTSESWFDGWQSSIGGRVAEFRKSVKRAVAGGGRRPGIEHGVREPSIGPFPAAP